MAGKVKVGIIGSRFEADIHAAAFQIMPDEAEVVAVASPTPGNPEALAQKYGIPRVFHDYRAMLGALELRLPPQEMHHFARCACGKETPIATARTAGSSRKFSWPAIARPGWARRSASPSAPLASNAPSTCGSARPMKISRDPRPPPDPS